MTHGTLSLCCEHFRNSAGLRSITLKPPGYCSETEELWGFMRGTSKRMRRAHYHNFPDDLQPSHVAGMMAHIGGTHTPLEDILGESMRIASVPGGYYSRAVAETAAATGYTMLFNSEPTSAVTTVGGCQVAVTETSGPPGVTGTVISPEAEIASGEPLAVADWTFAGSAIPTRRYERLSARGKRRR